MNKNKKYLKSFTEYCKAHPEQRFWQALRNWNQEVNPEHNFILAAEVADGYLVPGHVQEHQQYKNLEDTFYWGPKE